MGCPTGLSLVQAVVRRRNATALVFRDPSRVGAVAVRHSLVRDPEDVKPVVIPNMLCGRIV